MAGVWVVQRGARADELKDSLSSLPIGRVWVDCHPDTCRGGKAAMVVKLESMRRDWPDETYRMVKLGKL